MSVTKEVYTIQAAPKKHVLMNPAAWAMWGLDFGLWAGSLVGPYRWFDTLKHRRTQRSREIKTADRVSVYANGDEPLALVPTEPELTTAHELMQRNFRKFANCRCFGIRKYLGEHTPEGARFPLKLFGETTWLTYAEVGERSKYFGYGLIQLGLKPQPNNVVFDDLEGPHRMLVWEDTSAEFIMALIGANSQSIAVATSYATLGVAAVVEVLNAGGINTIVANYGQVENILKLKAKCPSLDTIIVSYHGVEDERRAKPLPKHDGVRLIAYDDVIALGKEKGGEFHPPTPDHVSVVMYTSGSTGTPKGVVIRQSSFVASVAALWMWIQHNDFFEEGKETYVAYLPSAHILELVAEHAMLSIGAEIGFADPRTITSRGACRKLPDGSIKTSAGWPHPPGALQEFRPTLLVGVPKVWDIIKKAVEQQISGSPLARFIFDVAFPARAAAVEQGRETPIFKALFKRVAAIAGGRLKFGLTGGGPCSSEVQTFVRTAFAMPFIQGYALTETCCAGSIQFISDPRNGVVGSPFASVRIRLAECPDIVDAEGKQYHPEDTMHLGQPCKGRGEVWISGPSVSVGYFREPEKTAEAFVEYDGRRWFKSGDIGCFTPDGCLRIVDRAKNLVKLKGGEYIAIEHMEAIYGTAPLVDAMNGGVMAYGDGELDRPIAFVQVVQKHIEEWADANGIKYSSFEELCENPRTEAYVTSELNAVGKRGGLSSLELLGGVKVFAGTGHKTNETPLRHDPWTPDNCGLTATSKINRKPLQAAFKGLLEEAMQKYGIRN